MKLFFKLCIALLLSIINSVYANEGIISISSKFNELNDLYSIEYQNKNAQDAYFRYKEHDISEWSNYIVMSKDTSGNFSGYAIFNSPGQKQIEIGLPQSASTIQPVLNTFIQVNPKKNGKEVEGGLFIGRYENDFLIPTTYFSNTDEIAIRFQFFRPINQIHSFSVYLNGFDVTSLVANIVKIREGYTYPSVEAIIPPFLVTALSTTTGNDSFVVTEINGKFYFSFIKISSTISTRRILPVVGGAAVASYLATACSVGAISSATVSILDFFIDMQIDYTGILPVPLIGYNGKTIDDFFNNIDNFATEIGKGCLTSVALPGTKFIPGVNQFISKIQSKIYQNMSSTYLPTLKAKILSFLTKLTEIPKTLSPFDKYTATSRIVTEFTDQIVNEIKSSWITPLKDLFFEYLNPSIVTISPNSGETYTTNAININVEATNADEILYNLTYSTSNLPTDPEEPTIEKHNGKIVGNKGVINTGSFSIQPKAGQLTIYKIKFRSNSFAGYGESTVVTYLFDLRVNLPDNIIASPLSGTWTTTPQLLSVSANNAEKIYCMVEETNDGTIPNDPPIPSETLNDPCVQGGSFISGSSGQFQLWGETGKLKTIKIRFRAWNQQGFSSVSPVYSYSIDLRAALKSGSLDPNFGNNGIVITDTGSAYDTMYDMALQSDGKMVIVGDSSIDQSNGIVLRYNQNGTLDSSFGNNGKILDSSYDYRAVTIQKDGKIVIAGERANMPLLRRYNQNGSIDTTFGTNGEVELNRYNWSVQSITIQEDGKILISIAAAGSSLILRYTSNGKLDEQFTFQSFYNYFSKLFPQSNGKIVTDRLARYNSDGSLDRSFAKNGFLDEVKITTSWGSFNVSPRFTTTFPQDNKFLVAAFPTDSYCSVCFPVIVRYDQNGILDTTFGNNGIVSLANINEVNDIVVQSDGKVLIGSSLYDYYGGVPDSFMIARYNIDGTLDTLFGETGKIITNIYPHDNMHQQGSIRKLMIQSDGKIIAAGNISSGQNNSSWGDFALVRYLP